MGEARYMKKDFKFSFVVPLQKTKFKTLSGVGTNISDKFRQIRNLGFKGVELAIRNPLEIDVSLLEKDLKRSGLEVSAIGTGRAFIDEGLSLSDPRKAVRNAAIERVKRHIDVASLLDAPVIIGLIRGNLPREEAKRKVFLRIFKEAFDGCLKYASRKDSFLLIEPINRYECNYINSVKEGISFIKEFRNSKLGLLADTFHMNIEDKSLSESITEASQYLRHVHIADSNRLFPGSGHINFKEVFDALDRIDYRSFISGEILPVPEESESMLRFSNFIKSIK